MRKIIIPAVIIFAALLSANAADAALIYLVSGNGQGVAEAENYSAKLDNPTPESWDILSSPSAGAFANASGGQYIQALPDDGLPASHSAGGTPYVDYTFRVPDNPSALGNYLLYFRAGGPNAGGDSLYWRVYDAEDMSIVATLNAGISVGNSTWDTGAWNNAATLIPVTEAGDYIVRFTPREDGVAIDKLAFQLSTLAAPTNFGPAVSAILVAPEPASGLLLACGIVLFARRAKQRTAVRGR